MKRYTSGDGFAPSSVLTLICHLLILYKIKPLSNREKRTSNMSEKRFYHEFDATDQTIESSAEVTAKSSRSIFATKFKYFVVDFPCNKRCSPTLINPFHRQKHTSGKCFNVNGTRRAAEITKTTTTIADQTFVDPKRTHLLNSSTGHWDPSVTEKPIDPEDSDQESEGLGEMHRSIFSIRKFRQHLYAISIR